MAAAFSRRFRNLIKCVGCSGEPLGPVWCLLPVLPGPPGPKDNLLYKSAVSKQFTSQSFCGLELFSLSSPGNGNSTSCC